LPLMLTNSSPIARSTLDAGEAADIEEIRAPDTQTG
jgi:hypothetical protein